MNFKSLELRRHRRGSTQRIIQPILEGILLILILPAVLLTLSELLDSKLLVPHFSLGLYNIPVGLLLIVVGLPFAIWAVSKYFTLGQRASVSGRAELTLITDGPFEYCRNPVPLGMCLSYLGMAIWMGSFVGTGLVLLFLALIVVYIKLVREAEMEAHFGPKYLAYKFRTPFLIPNLRKLNFPRFGE